MAGFYRGSTPTFKITPQGYSVTDLGTPVVTLSQEYAFKELPVEIDTANNCVIARLSYSDSLQFVGDTVAQLQCVWTNETDPENPKVVPFAPHEVMVLENYVQFTFNEDGTVKE